MIARVAALVLLASCTVDHVVATAMAFVAIDAGAGDAGPDEATLELQWGVYAQGLPIPACNDGGVLLVDALDDDLEGGPTITTRAAAGATLSLREAIFLAANTPGPHVINFDAAVFPPNAAATIHSDEDLAFPNQQLLDTCIDARGRGVIVEFGFTQFCQNNCAWELGPRSQMTGLVLKGNMGKMGVADALIAGNRFMITYQALQLFDGAVIGPSNVFGHGVFGVRLDFYSTSRVASVDGNFFGVEPTTGANLDLRVAISSFKPMRIIDNISFGAMQLSGDEGGTVTGNEMRGIASVVTVQGKDWQLSQNNFVGEVHNLTTMAIGNRFLTNTFAGIFTSGNGVTAAPTDGGVGSIEGGCPAEGQVEVYLREGTTFRPLGFAPCHSGQPTWSFSSGELARGAEAATLFTGATTKNTGAFSPSFDLP